MNRNGEYTLGARVRYAEFFSGCDVNRVGVKHVGGEASAIDGGNEVSPGGLQGELAACVLKYVE